jgi:putative transposase
MSLARPILPGKCYMVTRRCSQRRFLMRPDGDTTNAFLYCLAYAASRTGVGIVFFIACSNHWHGGIIDHEGRLPEFLECFHKLFAKHQNARFGRWENFWASEQTSVVQLIGPEDVLAKAAYAVSNPVKDHLVEKASEWIGASSWSAHLDGRPLTASRPLHFFRADGPMPDKISITLAEPPGFEHLGQAGFADLLREQVRQVERLAAQRRAQTGTAVLGMKAVLKQRVGHRPKSREPRRKLNPRVACRNTWRRIEALARNRHFLLAYRAARDLLVAGAQAIFPAGSYWLPRFVGVRCEPLPDTTA